MSRAYQIGSICEAFDAACEQFASLIGDLHSGSALEMEHGEIEVLISEMGTELMRLLLQAHLDIRAMQEPRRHDIQAVDGQALPRCRSGCTRDLMTPFGEVVVKRKGYSTRGKESLFPLDGELNLPEDKYSHGLRRRVAEEVATSSFDSAVERIARTTGGKIPKRQAEEIAVAVAQDFDGFYAERTSGEATSDPLIMSVDQKGIVMRKEDLRPSTRKAAEKGHSGARLSPGEKPNRKRMATVAAVYSIEASERTPESVMGHDRQERPRAREKRVWASVEHDPEEVIKAIFDEAMRRDPERSRPWAVLLDGAEKQLEHVLDLILRYRPDTSVILDFIHVLEYVWKAAYVVCAGGSKEAEQWVGERALEILQGQALSVALEMRRSAGGLGVKERKPVDRCANYLEKYETLLDYHEYLKEGLPIATGVIEGACRHLIKDRMDITGARWRLARAEAVLRIRSLKSSGDFETYWSFHLERERERNHPYCTIPKPMTVKAEERQSSAHDLELLKAA